MSYLEKINISALIGMALIIAWYASAIVPQLDNVPVEEISYGKKMIIAIIAHVVFVIGASILIAIKDRNGLNGKFESGDERDRRLEVRADAIGGNILSALIVPSLIMLMMDVQAFWIANALFLSLALTAMLSFVIKAIDYRRGI